MGCRKAWVHQSGGVPRIFYTQLMKKLGVEDVRYAKSYVGAEQEYFLVDANDWETAKEYSWLLTINSDGYKSIKGNVGKKLIKLTEFIGCKYYDHINRNSLDCRRRKNQSN